MKPEKDIEMPGGHVNHQDHSDRIFGLQTKDRITNGMTRSVTYSAMFMLDA